jgi:hypothetical protein
MEVGLDWLQVEVPEEGLEYRLDVTVAKLAAVAAVAAVVEHQMKLEEDLGERRTKLGY